MTSSQGSLSPPSVGRVFLDLQTKRGADALAQRASSTMIGVGNGPTDFVARVSESVHKCAVMTCADVAQLKAADARAKDSVVDVELATEAIDSFIMVTWYPEITAKFKRAHELLSTIRPRSRVSLPAAAALKLGAPGSSAPRAAAPPPPTENSTTPERISNDGILSNVAGGGAAAHADESDDDGDSVAGDR